jgi:hypothetical protein
LHNASGITERGEAPLIGQRINAGGGAVGDIAGAKVATAFVGGIALAFDVTLGASALAVAAIAGAAAGAYYGGSGGGGFGEYVGDIIYQRVNR